MKIDSKIPVKRKVWDLTVVANSGPSGSPGESSQLAQVSFESDLRPDSDLRLHIIPSHFTTTK